VNALSNVGAIVQKELRHYFGGPIAYVALVIWTFLFGYFFIAVTSYLVRAASMGPGRSPSLTEAIAALFGNVAIVALFILPVLTMRLFAEEKRQGTIELLATAPITDLQIVVGKFLGAWALFALMLAAGFLNLVPLWKLASAAPEWRPVTVAVLGLLLLGGAFISMGMFVSSLTKNQVIAGVVTFGLALILWLLDWLVSSDPTTSPALRLLGYLGFNTHLETLLKGVVDLKDVVFFLSVIVAGIFLTQRSLESQRWRA